MKVIKQIDRTEPWTQEECDDLRDQLAAIHAESLKRVSCLENKLKTRPEGVGDVADRGQFNEDHSVVSKELAMARRKLECIESVQRRIHDEDFDAGHCDQCFTQVVAPERVLIALNLTCPECANTKERKAQQFTPRRGAM